MIVAGRLVDNGAKVELCVGVGEPALTFVDQNSGIFTLVAAVDSCWSTGLSVMMRGSRRSHQMGREVPDKLHSTIGLQLTQLTS